MISHGLYLLSCDSNEQSHPERLATLQNGMATLRLTERCGIYLPPRVLISTPSKDRWIMITQELYNNKGIVSMANGTPFIYRNSLSVRY